MKATGTFDVKITPQASDLAPEGPNLGRMSLDKQFQGDLAGTGKGEMITAAGIAVKESAAYSAVERITGRSFEPDLEEPVSRIRRNVDRYLANS